MSTDTVQILHEPERDIITLGQWQMSVWKDLGDGEPRIRDLDVAERLRFDRPRDVRKLILRTWPSLAPLSDHPLRLVNDSSGEQDAKTSDVLNRATAARLKSSPALGDSPANRQETEMVRVPPRGPIVRTALRRWLAGKAVQREELVNEFWLTEGDVLKLCARSSTPIADAILDEMIRVYLAVRREQVTQFRAPPIPDDHELLEKRTAALEAFLKRGGNPGCLRRRAKILYGIFPYAELSIPTLQVNGDEANLERVLKDFRRDADDLIAARRWLDHVAECAATLDMAHGKELLHGATLLARRVLHRDLGGGSAEQYSKRSSCFRDAVHHCLDSDIHGVVHAFYASQVSGKGVRELLANARCTDPLDDAIEVMREMIEIFKIRYRVQHPTKNELAL